VKEKLAVSSTVYITIHDFIVTAQQQPQPNAVGMRLPPPLTHHHSIACYKKQSVLIVCGGGGLVPTPLLISSRMLVTNGQTIRLVF